MEEIILRIATALPGFLVAIVVHEVSHAYVAERFGDSTARQAGRVTLNPLAHLDLFGTVLLPIILAAVGGWMFGWAKPVPVNTRNFKKVRKAIFWVSFAGPASNIILGILFAILRGLVISLLGHESQFLRPVTQMLEFAVVINFVLATFNLIPFPPLDGSKMVSSFLSYNNAIRYESLQRYTFIFIMILWFTRIFNYILAPVYMFAYFLMNFFAKLFWM